MKLQVFKHTLQTFYVFLCIGILGLFSCQTSENKSESSGKTNNKFETSRATLIILGTVQDGGSPHPGCTKDCCNKYFVNSSDDKKIISLGIVDHINKKSYLFDASPDFPTQTSELNQLLDSFAYNPPSGIFLTHAHIGHYTGLMYLGREAQNAHSVPVFAMPKMKKFLETNAPWSQLVSLVNIQINPLKQDTTFQFSEMLSVTAFTVPHRDEFSETVGFFVQGPTKKLLFIPDIDKWSKWNRDIIKEIQKVDYAFIDGTFFDAKEINYRDISEIPHPFVVESMELFQKLSQHEKDKIFFIHLNHTNPLLNDKSEEFLRLKEAGFNVARKGMRFAL